MMIVIMKEDLSLQIECVNLDSQKAGLAQPLFNCYRLGKVPWLIHITAPHNSDVIGKKL